jgi:hypothetical protein
MHLPPADAALFYRAWGALLAWVNEQRRIVPAFPRPTPGQPIEMSLANQIRKVVWADDSLRERFLAEGASDLGDAERDLIASWRHRISGQFIILKHLQKHSIFMSKEVYAVVGIYTPFAELFPFVPMYVHAVLIPFRDVIITDGILESPPMQISFGGGARRMFQQQYSIARVAGEIRRSLPWQAVTAPDTPARPKRASAKPSRGRVRRRTGSVR